MSTVFKQFELEFLNEPLPLEFKPIEPTDGLKYILGLGARIAVDQSTEKARSEFIIAPILLEVRAIAGNNVSVFSGIEFNVDSEKGLIGICDFLFSRSNQQLFLEAPILTVVEAKNENFKQGIAQATAEMVAAQIFNQREGKPVSHIYGAVTIGNQWQFLSLVEKTLRVDNRFYNLDDLSSILGIMATMLK